MLSISSVAVKKSPGRLLLRHPHTFLLRPSISKADSLLPRSSLFSTTAYRTPTLPLPRQQQQQRRMFALTPSRPSQPKTFTHQKDLPRLPIPQLEASLDRYIKSLRPIFLDKGLDVESEVSKRKQWAEDFVKEGGLGRRLQERLIDVDRASPNNWLDDTIWIKAAYHSWRVPLPVNSNWWILFAHDPDVPKEVLDLKNKPADGEFTNWQVKRAAQLTRRLVNFKERLDSEDILPDSSRAGPFCMHQYSRCYGVTRLPGTPTDTLVHAPHPHPSDYVVVMVRDQFYKVVVAGKSREEIEGAFWGVVADVEALGEEGRDVAVGVLTGDERDSWTKTREHLISISPQNRQTLKTIEDSLFVVSLDDYTRIHPSPTSTHPSSTSSSTTSSLDLDSHILNSCAGKEGHNRWFDKAVSIHIENNSRGGMMGEHSPVDALIPSIVADYTLAEGIAEGGAEVGRKVEARKEGWEKIRFVTDAQVEEDVRKAEGVVRAIVEDSEGLMLWFDDYGADWIKKVGKQSPDAYLQMALQYAWYKMAGSATATYETASTRLFKHGRTDVIRTLSEDSYKFVKAMTDKSQPPTELYKLLTAATTAHNQYTRDSSMGKGCDRHLMGLRLCLKEGESHRLFEDEVFGESQSWKLSTSGLSAGDRFFGTGFGTVWPDGYGINYLAGGKVVKFGIESKRSCPTTSTEKFRGKIVEALREMREVCEKGVPEQKPVIDSGNSGKGQGQATAKL